MHRTSLADELAEIRSDIARLRLREAQLRDMILKAPEAALTGRWSRVEVVESRHSVFDSRLLPMALRDDPLYRAERVVTQLRCLPLPARGPRPGWPIRRDAGQGDTGWRMLLQ